MESPKYLILIALFLSLPILAHAQTLNEIDENGNISQPNGNQNFNPHNRDTTQQKTVPKGIYVWTVDRRFGDMHRTDVDTVPHLYPQSTMAPGMYGDYNTIGSNYTARLSRIFANRKPISQTPFTDAYDQILKQPDEWHFTNTLSPITNLSYGSCGDKTNGEDLIDARFAVNAGKHTGLGFDLDYRYARGYYASQNNSHFGSSFFVTHLGDRYQMHLLFQNYHQKATENGGVQTDEYITHPEFYTESYSDNEIPTVLESNWNRNDHQHLFLTHRYSVGFYRKVPMTEEEIKAKKEADEAAKAEEAKKDIPQGRPDDAVIAGDEAPDETQETPEDSGRITVDSKEMADSLIAAEPVDSASLYTKKEFVPVTSLIHTAEVNRHNRTYLAYFSPQDYYADTFYDRCPKGTHGGDSINDQTKYFGVRNTLAISLLEGFNKYAPAGLKAFAAHDLRRFDMPSLAGDDSTFMDRWTEHSISLGGQLVKAQGNTLHYDLTAEAWVAGEDAGQLKLDASADLNIPLLGDTVRFDAKAYLHRLNPVFLQRHYHSKHLWWDNDLSKETRTHLEGKLSFAKTGTTLRAALDEIEKYTYLAMDYTLGDEGRTALTAAYRQHDASLTVLTAQLDQRLNLGPLHWDNIVTLQTVSDEEVLPLPKLNVFTNLYLQFMVARVLRVELGASGTWFTKYYAPDFLPQLNQYAVQQNSDSRIELGNFPFVDVYANLHLKHARFFVMMTNVLGKDFDRMSFLTPHYPLNRSVLHLGISWNFFN